MEKNYLSNDVSYNAKTYDSMSLRWLARNWLKYGPTSMFQSYDKRQIRTKGGPIIPDPDALFNIAKCRCFEKKYPLAPEPKESDFQIEKCKCKVTDE